MNDRHLGSPLAVLVAALLSPCPAALAQDDPVKKKEPQSAFKDSSGTVISSSKLVKKLRQKLDNAYEDLEIVLSVCASGEFADRAKGAGGLQGQWSVSTSTDTKHVCEDEFQRKDKKPGGIEGLPVKDGVYHGYMAQYVKKLRESNAREQGGQTPHGNKTLHDTAEANKHQTGDDPNYQSSGDAADGMSVHGGKKSNHAIVFSAAGYTELSDELYKALKGAGYTDDTIDYLTGTGARNIAGDTAKSDGAATEKKLDEALDDLRKDLDKNAKEEKAYLFITAHGSYGDRTVAFSAPPAGVPGEGLVVGPGEATVSIFADSPELLVGLMEELPMAGGGVWSDDPRLQRQGDAYLAFSTSDERFTTASTLVDVLLNGHALGTVELGGSQGADYILDISDSLLDVLMADILATGLLDVSFAFPTAGDFFRLATEADYLSAGMPHLFDYGITLGTITGSLAPVPEPGTLALLASGWMLLTVTARLRGRSTSTS